MKLTHTKQDWKGLNSFWKRAERSFLELVMPKVNLTVKSISWNWHKPNPCKYLQVSRAHWEFNQTNELSNWNSHSMGWFIELSISSPSALHQLSKKHCDQDLQRVYRKRPIAGCTVPAEYMFGWDFGFAEFVNDYLSTHSIKTSLIEIYIQFKQALHQLSKPHISLCVHSLNLFELNFVRL